jgi:response regulator of citrate/malate metabolism
MGDFKILNRKQKAVSNNEISVLLVGNNPIELGLLYEKISGLKGKINKIETAFSLEDTLKKIHLMHPNCLLLDDNLGLNPLKAIINNVNALSKEVISITLLKSHNKQEVTSGVQEYIMKEGIDGTRIYNALINALRFKKTQQFFRIKYYSGKRSIKRLFI